MGEFNPHPPLAMFPPVVSMLMVILELAALRIPAVMTARLRVLLSVILLISATLAYYTGFYGVDFAPDVPLEVIRSHQGFARFSALLSVPTALFATLILLSPKSQKALNWSYLGAILLQCSLLMFTSHLGGKLVFEWGAGVAKQSPATPSSELREEGR